MDDLDTPTLDATRPGINTTPGYCPECGQKANIWEAVSQTWECSLCDWKGRTPNPQPPEYSR